MILERQFFGTDGIRGRVGEPPITPEMLLKLGWAAGKVLAHGHAGNKVVIGKDTRVSGYLIESLLEAGLCSAGVNISLTGPMPTPGIAYLTRTARGRAGIVISASHNRYDDNGIKFFSVDGYKLPDETELEIERMMSRPMRTVASARLGKAERYADAPGRYIEFCKSTIDQRLNLDGVKVVVDCANGASYEIAPHVFRELGAEVVAIGNHPDGFNINEACGSTHPAQLQSRVVEEDADLGIAFDGDGDRVLLVDENGRIVDGDQMLYIMSRRRLDLNQLHGGVVGTLMSNFGLEVALRRAGIPFERAAVGDRYVFEALKVNGWRLGGETSGHIICLDKSTTGDGIIAALDVLSAMIEGKARLSELAQGMEHYPQTMINVGFEAERGSAAQITTSKLVESAVSEVEGQLGDSGRVVLRPSGTEPVIRVMVEGIDAAQVKRLAENLAGVVASAASS